MPFLSRCVENVQYHHSVSILLQLLVQIVEHYPTQSYLKTGADRLTIVSHLTSDKKLIQ